VPGPHNYGGYYQYDFAPVTAQFWRVQLSNTPNYAEGNHMPRTQAVQFGRTGPETVTSYEWNADGIGIWNLNTNWTPSSGRPGFGEDTALFGTNITGPTTVGVNSPVTVNRIEFNNGNHTYVIAGASHIDLAADSAGGPPSVEVLAGSHEIQARVNLQTGTFLSVATDNPCNSTTV